MQATAQRIAKRVVSAAVLPVLGWFPSEDTCDILAGAAGGRTGRLRELFGVQPSSEQDPERPRRASEATRCVIAAPLLRPPSKG